MKFKFVKMYCLLFATFSMLGKLQAQAPATAANIKSVSDLKKLVEENKITEINQLLPLLPPAMLQNPLLAYESHALNTYLVTPETPRIILWSADASFVMSVSRDPGYNQIQKGEDVIEFIQVNPQTKKFEMGKVSFNGIDMPFQKDPEMNPKLCLQCHGSNPRPIFDSYNAWPGFYGSFGTNGYAIKDSLEFKNLNQFLQNYKDNKLEPRYQALDLSGYVQNDKGIMTVSRGFGDLPTQVKMSINMMFGVNLEARMWERLAAKLQNQANFQAIAPVLYYLGEETNRCGNPRDRVNQLSKKWLARPGFDKEATALLEKINQQIDTDHQSAESILLKNNSTSDHAEKNIDELGIASIFFSNKHELRRQSQPATFVETTNGVQIERPFIDNENFQNMVLMAESIFRRLNFSTEDLSTRPDRPTNGVYHLKRLGRLFKDEQLFQNMFSAIAAADPKVKSQYDSLSCAEILEKSNLTMKKIPVAKAAKKGIFYK